ncbi:MAG: hypothetical protein RIR51_2053 [Bacteroidota bacterium]
MEKFKALLTQISPQNEVINSIEYLPMNFLKEDGVLIKVHYSSLNYKDALSYSGHKGVTRNYPHIPGIDAIGEIVEDPANQFKPGSLVLVTGFDMGMNTHGGISEYISVPSNWIIEASKFNSLRYQMELGTAGLTAGMAVFQLLKNDISKDKPVLVSGASGGLGLISILILKKLGFSVIALTRKTDFPIFKTLSVDEVLDVNDFLMDTSRALYPMEFSGAIDTVGGDILVKIIKSVQMGGSVAVCGMANSTKMDLEVFPFILRGIKVLGINSADSPLEYKKSIWDLLNNDWKVDLNPIIQEIKMEEVPIHLNKMLDGTSFGRKIVRIIP